MIDPELQKRIAKRLIRWLDSRGTMGEAVDGVFGEIEEAGYSVVETASLERLREYYRSSQAVEHGVVDFELHHTMVDRLKAATSAILPTDLGDHEHGPVDG